MEEWIAQGTPLALVHPDDREQFQSGRKKRFLEGAPHEFEARLRRHDGQFRCFLIRYASLKDERGHITQWYGTGTDIEDRKRAEDKIRKKNIALREEIIIIVSKGESFAVDESWLSGQPLRTSPTSQPEFRQRVAERVAAEEKQAIEAALTESRGRVFGPSGAAARLGIARSTLDAKIKTLKIDKNRFKVSNPS
jgi:hypothetical protein